MSFGQDFWEPIHQIEEHLYLGNIKGAVRHVLDHNISVVLSITTSIIHCRERVEGTTYLHIYALDLNDQDLLTHFPQTYQLIDNCVSSGQNVLVHCGAGKSRSATIVIAYVMQKYKMSVQSAIDLVKSKRNIISPNNGFKKQLILYKEMDFTLDAKNKRLRNHLIRCHTIFINRNEFLKEYFDRRSLVEGMSPNLDFGQQYDCSNCGFKLFNEIHIIEMNYSNEDIDCLTIDVEPQEWMERNLTSHGMVGFGTINCKNCNEIKGEFFPTPCLRIEMMTKSYVKH